MYEVFEQLLQKFGVKASDVSKGTGVGASTFSDWKNGRCTPRTENLQKIADYFGVPLDYLMKGEEGLKRAKFIMDKYDLLLMGLKTIGWEWKTVGNNGEPVENPDDEAGYHHILTNGITMFEVSSKDMHDLENDATDFFAQRVRSLMMKSADEITQTSEES